VPQQHRVSRSVTREAVKMLTAKGLLSARPRSLRLPIGSELSNVEPLSRA
jgi:DNA-binding FadR family transcriptional regulator